MSILIKGMEMPVNCYLCDICGDYKGKDGETAYGCKILHRVVPFEAGFKHKDCPLVPVQKHGRLIDADALLGNTEIISYKDEWHMTTTEAFVSVKSIIDAPTVIEAEGGE